MKSKLKKKKQNKKHEIKRAGQNKKMATKRVVAQERCLKNI